MNLKVAVVVLKAKFKRPVNSVIPSLLAISSFKSVRTRLANYFFNFLLSKLGEF